ncbi:hypothetical protein JCM33374_g2965 [Metschnikowia sp. JCM 33374]|nr:hypothetical protein JCM33374_g2965 [Metschnikowia sp. JCM 33374]
MPRQIILQNPPSGAVNLTWGQPDSTFQLAEVEVPEIQPGELKVRSLYFSNDPTQRLWIAANQDPQRQYMAPVFKGEPIRSLGLAEVMESKSDKYVAGDVVSGFLHWADVLVIPESSVTTKVDKSLPYEWYLSAIGLTGLTAYFGLKKTGLLQPGQTILVSAASGATGSMVVQLAKHLFKASKVVGVAGSEEKCRWVESLGADLCVNYRDADYLQQLDNHMAGEYFDVYFDNVGGEMFDYALRRVKRYGRIVVCGAIAGYNDTPKMVIESMTEVFSNRLTIQGFLVFDYLSEFDHASKEIIDIIKSGQVSGEDGVHVDDLSQSEGALEKVPEVWHKLFTEEKPRGKLLTKLV